MGDGVDQFLLPPLILLKNLLEFLIVGLEQSVLLLQLLEWSLSKM